MRLQSTQGLAHLGQRTIKHSKSKTVNKLGVGEQFLNAASMVEAIAVIGAMNKAASAVDKLVSITRDCVATQRKLSLYPNQLAAFKTNALAVGQVLAECPPGSPGSQLHTARSALSNAVDNALVCTLYC